MTCEPHPEPAPTSIQPLPEPLNEVAEILAIGLLRMHHRSALRIAPTAGSDGPEGRDPGPSPDSSPDSSELGLEVPGAWPLHGPERLTGTENAAPATRDTEATP